MEAAETPVRRGGREGGRERGREGGREGGKEVDLCDPTCVLLGGFLALLSPAYYCKLTP